MILLNGSNRHKVTELKCPFYSKSCNCTVMLFFDSFATKIQSESMDFIELVFNPNLYQVMLEQMNKSKDQYIHYLIVLVEFTKMEKYMETKSRLDTILSDSKISNTILTDGIKQASDERIINCKERITSTIADLKKNFSSFGLSAQGIDMLLESNNLVL